MKKKFLATQKDKKDWTTFTKNLSNISDKEIDFNKRNVNKNEIKKLDLHGFAISQANIRVKKFINISFDEGYKKLLIITGKGLRSQVYKDPYRSNEMNILKNSVPDFIKNDKNLSSKIIRISKADKKDGGDGAIYIFLKNKLR